MTDLIAGVLVDLDVLLFAVQHEVHTYCTFCYGGSVLYIYINSVLQLTGSLQIAAGAYRACKVQCLLQLSLVQEVLVTLAEFHRRLLGLDVLHCRCQSCEVAHELGNTNIGGIAAGDVLGLRCAEGIVGVVSTGVVYLGVDGSNINLCILIEGIVHGRLGHDAVTDLIAGVLVDLDVLLFAAQFEVHTYCTFCYGGSVLDEHVDRIGGFVSGQQETVAINFACKVQVLVQLSLVQEELVSLAKLRLCNHLRHEELFVLLQHCIVQQHIAGSKLIAGSIILAVVGQVAVNRYHTTCLNALEHISVALHAEALDGLILAAGNSYGDGHVAIGLVVSFVNTQNGCDHDVRPGQSLACFQCVELVHQLFLGHTGVQLAALCKLNAGTVVVHDSAGNCDIIARCDLICAFTGQTIARNGLILHIFNDHQDSYIAIIAVIR